MISGAFSPRQSICISAAWASISDVGLYVNSIVHRLSWSILYIFEHVCCNGFRPVTSPSVRISIIFTGALAVTVIVCVFTSPTIVLTQSIVSGEIFNVIGTSSGFSNFSLSRLVNNNVNNIKTTTNAAANNSH